MTPDEKQLNELARRAIGAGYRAHGVPGDGNCQFHALLAALLGAVDDGIIDAIELERASVDGELDAGTLRARLVDWLEQNGDKDLGYGHGSLSARHNQVHNDHFAWDEYLAKMRSDKPDESGAIEWGVVPASSPSSSSIVPPATAPCSTARSEWN